MANVVFKRGNQANLPASGSAVNGTFYFTEDTNRLYLGKANGERVLLNQTVSIYPSLDVLQSDTQGWSENQRRDHTNDFYYLTAENILCVWNGTEWKQINPDDDTKVSSVVVSASAANNVASAEIRVNSSNITTGATDHKEDTLTITGAGGITAAASGKNITLTGRTYTLNQPAAAQTASSSVALTLTSSSGVAADNSTVTLRSANNDLEFQPTASTIDLIVNNTKLSQNNDAVAVSSSAGTVQVTVKDSDGSTYSGSATNVGIVQNDGTIAKLNDASDVTNMTAAELARAPYSKDQIDAMINGLDGMTYKGTIGSSGATVPALPSSGVKNGDTYVIVEDDFVFPSTGVTFESHTVQEMTNIKVGDMVIAKGTEGNDGNITAASLVWTYIPSGNDSLSNVTYTPTIDAANDSILLKNGNNTTIMKIDLDAGTGISLSSTASPSTNSNTLTTTISHATVSTTASEVSTTQLPSDATANPVIGAENTDGGASFAAITNLTISNGHVTNVEKGKFVPVTYNLMSPVVTQTANTNDAIVTVRLQDSNLTQKASSAIKITSDTITLTPGGSGHEDTVNMELVWGTF